MTYAYPTWSPDPTKILTRRELSIVLTDANRKARRSANARRNRVILRLACCCGLRVSEIAGLQVQDVIIVGPRPHIRVRGAIAKGQRRRMVPLWWDAGTLADLAAWKAERLATGARPTAPFVCSVLRPRYGKLLQRAAIRRRFLQVCKPLGAERVATLAIHHGRHTFISHALAGGRTLAEVKAAAGHSSLVVTSGYVHIAVDEEACTGQLFQLAR